MKREEHRHTIIPRVEPLPKAEPRPCMRGVLDIELYNRTGEIEYIEPLTEYVPPQDVEEDVEVDRMVKGRFRKLNVNKPSKDQLETDLRDGMTIAEIAKKYEASVAGVNSWIKLFGLKGIKGKQKPEEALDMVQHSPTLEETMIQTSPSLEEIEQFHTDMPIQGLPKVEMPGVEGPIPPSSIDGRLEEAPRETFDEIWDDVKSDLVTLERLYLAQAKKSFRERLQEMLVSIIGEPSTVKEISNA